MYELIALISLFTSSYILLRLIRLGGLAESILALFCLLTAHILLWGYALSLADCLGDVARWAQLSLATAVASCLLAIWRRTPRLSTLRADVGYLSHIPSSALRWYTRDISAYERLLLTPLISTMAVLGTMNLAVVLFTAPGNWDGMTYQLARVAYYLQQGTASYFGADYWAQVVHPKNPALLLAYTYLISGRSENLTQLPQFIAYWVAVCGLYAISRRVGNRRTESLFAAAVGALLVEWLMQATTTQNDMLLTAYIGALCGFLFAFRQTHEPKYAALTGLSAGLALGTKASAFLAGPSLLALGLYCAVPHGAHPRISARGISILAGSTLLAAFIFALPSGYVENYVHLGNPVAPAGVRQMLSFEGQPIPDILATGTKNLLRYGSDFLSLDGLPAMDSVRSAQARLRWLPERVLHRLGIETQTPKETRIPFSLQKLPAAHEDYSYWGILGFGLVWITVLLSLVGIIQSADLRYLSLAAILFAISQAYAGPYDPWRGRYFAICAIFAVPTVAPALRVRIPLVRAYLISIIFIGCVSALSAVILRNDGALVSASIDGASYASIFSMSRMEQLTRNASDLYQPLEAFDRLTPGNASVAIFLRHDSFEYPLFGEHLTRTILPVNSFLGGPQAVPSNADYLLYAQDEYRCGSPTDVLLGTGWYLRRLTNANRQCP